MDPKEMDTLTQTCEKYAQLVKSHAEIWQVYAKQGETLKTLGAEIATAMRKLYTKEGVETLTVGDFKFTFQRGKGTWDIAQPYTKGDVYKAIEAESLGARLFSKDVDPAKVRKFAESITEDNDEGRKQLKRLHIEKSYVDWFTLGEGVNNFTAYGKPSNRLK